MTTTGLLQVALIILKITDIISWPWLWVLSPSWLSVIGCIVVFVLHILTAHDE